MSLRHAKIVCTLGPATDDVKAIGDLIDAGMDVARLNFSHGTHDDHARRLTIVREAARARGSRSPCCRICRGRRSPPARAGRPRSERARRSGWSRVGIGSNDSLAVEYPGLAADLHAGDVVRLDDGRIVLRVDRIDAGCVVCAVVQGGSLRDRMGVNLPSRRVRLPALTDQDRRDLRTGSRSVSTTSRSRSSSARTTSSRCETRAGRPVARRRSSRRSRHPRRSTICGRWSRPPTR